MTVAVSVIIPVFNQEKFIGRCLRSILNQCFSPSSYEVIVVNDASTDQSRFVIDSFVGPTVPKVTLLENPVNLGLAGTLNKALVAAKGKYVVRLDADDFVNSNFLVVLHTFCEMGSGDAFACDYLLVEENEDVIRNVSCSDEPIGCGVMFRKQQLLDVGGYDGSLRSHEDKELMIRFLRNHAVTRVPLPLYRYRRHGANMTNDAVAMEIEWQKVLQKHDQI